ncbi:MAG: histidinol dehydrogenase, partial [Acidobacteria bacterium]
MRIIRLNRKVADDLLRARGRRDAAAENIAARIVADVRRRGDAALFYWTKKLDGAGLAHEGVFISRHELRVARNCVSA